MSQDDNYDAHLFLANRNLGQLDEEVAHATNLYNAYIRQGNDGAAEVQQRELNKLIGERKMLIDNVNAHLASLEPRQAPSVSKEQREQRLPHEMDVYDLAKVTGLDPKTYMNYKQYYDQLKKSGSID